MSPLVSSLRKILSAVLVASLLTTPVGVVQAKGGKSGDHKKRDDDDKGQKSSSNNKNEKGKEAKTKVPKRGSGASEKEKERAEKKKPQREESKPVKQAGRPERHVAKKDANKHEPANNKNERRKELVKRPQKLVHLPASPFKFAPSRFAFEQPSFATPQPRARSTIPPAADLRRSRTREVVVALPDHISDSDTLTLGSGLSLDVTVQNRLPLLGMKIVRLRVPEGRDITQALTAVIDQSVTDERILEVQPNFVFETAQAAIGAMVSSIPQYATEKVRLGEAHRISLGRNVRVAVIDTGLDGTHPELAGVAIESFDAIGEGSPTTEAHGTAVAGIVAARQQIRGMAPDARVLAVRAFAAAAGQRPEATTLSIINGIHWAIANGARVINMSFAGPKDALLQRAIEAGIAKGVIFVAAAGNGGPTAAQAYPAAYPGVIAVTAIDSNDQLYGMANRGEYIALAAPGVDILAPAPNSSYEMSSGTSLAAAHVSGIIALMLERRPTLSAEEARSILKRTARDPGHTAMLNGLGAGIIDAARAVADIK